MPCPQGLTEVIEPLAIDKKMFVREIVFTIASYNIGAVAEKSHTNGVIVFAGKVYKIVDVFEQRKLKL